MQSNSDKSNNPAAPERGQVIGKTQKVFASGEVQSVETSIANDESELSSRGVINFALKP